MATRSKTAQSAFDIAEPLVTQMGLDLVDVEYKKEGNAYFLRVFVDRKGGITIDECEKVSKVLNPIFDQHLSADPDYFEVSSPGLTRPLKTKRDFLRCIDQEVEVKFFRARENKKITTGVIKEIRDDELILETEEKTDAIPLPEIASAKRVIRFR